MPFRYSLILAALFLAGRAEGQAIVCPDVPVSYEVGSRVVTLRWQDPPDSVRSRITVSLNKVGIVPCGPDSVCSPVDSLSWRATSAPTIGGLYRGGCDITYRFRNLFEIPFFSTVDTARVSEVWTGGALPISGGTFRSCADVIEFRFTVESGGTVGPEGSGAVVGWRADSIGQTGTVTIPAGSEPGAFLDVFAGLQVGFTAGTLVAGESFMISTRIPRPATIEWSRPTSAFEDTSDQIIICRPDTAVAVEFGVTLSLGPGVLPAYTAEGDTVAVFRARVETFDGFRVYRSDISDLRSFALLREYNLCRKADSSFFQSGQHAYEDTEVHDGFPYRYFVTCYDTLSKSESDTIPSATLYPRTDPGGSVAGIHVVPNPYKRRTAWEEAGEPKIQFINVPVDATIRIYTAAGSLVRVIGPDQVSQGCGASTLPGCVNWNLRNGQDEDVVSGIYIFQAESPGGGDTVGKFMVAR